MKIPTVYKNLINGIFDPEEEFDILKLSTLSVTLVFSVICLLLEYPKFTGLFSKQKSRKSSKANLTKDNFGFSVKSCYVVYQFLRQIKTKLVQFCRANLCFRLVFYLILMAAAFFQLESLLGSFCFLLVILAILKSLANHILTCLQGQENLRPEIKKPEHPKSRAARKLSQGQRKMSLVYFDAHQVFLSKKDRKQVNQLFSLSDAGHDNNSYNPDSEHESEIQCWAMI